PLPSPRSSWTRTVKVCGLFTSLTPLPAMLISALTLRTVAVAALEWMRLGNAPRFCASVKTALDVSVRGVGSPAGRAGVSVKVNDAPGAREAGVAVLLPARAWTASASMSPNRLLVNESGSPAPWFAEFSTRLGLSAELVLLTVYV